MHFKVIFISLLIISCSKKEKYESVQLFGHAGNGLNISNSMYHDNSEQSIHLALAQNGCDGVEVDVQLSKDGTAWLFHDQNLKVETGLDNCINSLTDEEISNLSYTHFNDEKLMKLVDVKLNGKGVLLDVRHVNICENKVVDIEPLLSQIAIFHQNNLSSTIYLNTTKTEWLMPLKTLGLITSYSPTPNDKPEDIVSTYGVNTFVFKNDISEDRVKTLQNKGYTVIVYDVRSPKGIRSALKKHPDIILTDDLKAAIIEKY